MYKKHLNVIDENAKIFCGISDALWDHPELPFEEYEASKMISN